MQTNDDLPAMLVGIGGGGNDMGIKFCSQDYVQDLIIKPRPNPEKVKAILIDSAQEDKNEYIRRIDELTDEYDERREEYITGDNENPPGQLDISHISLTDEIPQNTKTALTGSKEVRNIANANDMDPDDWWLDSTDITHNLSFAKGVRRRRALGKATLYRALASNNKLDNQLDTPEPGKIAVFVGLGGGTGSGILPDIIEMLHDNNPNNEITVFATIPSSSEPNENVHANAYAALCELESMCLGSENLVNDVVLYHLHPSEYEGKEGNQLKGNELSRFDEAFTQSVIAYYNADGENQFNRATPEFAPFTVAIPQVAEYNIERIEKAETLMESRLKARKRMYEHERELFDDLRDLFGTINIRSDRENELPDEDQTAIYNRINQLENLASEELFTKLEYTSSEVFAEIFEDAKSKVEEEPGTDNSGAIATELDHHKHRLSSNTQTRGDVDTLLGEVLLLGIENLANRTELLKKRQGINDPELKRVVGPFLRPDTKERKLNRKFADLRREKENIEEETEAVKTELEDARQKLQDQRESQQSQLNQAHETWKNKTKNARAELHSHDINSIEDLLRELISELGKFADEVQAADSKAAADAVDRTGVFNAISDIEDYEEDVQTDPMNPITIVDRDNINTACDTLIEARKLHLDANESNGLIGSLLGNSKDDAAARKDLGNCRADLQEQGVFSLPNARDEFNVQLNIDDHSKMQEIKSRKKGLLEDVIGVTKDVYSDITGDLSSRDIERIKNAVTHQNNSQQRVQEIIEAGSGDDPDLKRKVEELDREHERLSEKSSTYETAKEILGSICSDKYKKIEAAKNKAEKSNQQYDQQTETLSGNNNEAFKRTLQPENVISAAGKDNLAELELLESDTDRQRLQDVLGEFRENVLSSNYHGLQERLVEGTETSYYGTDVNVGIVSPIPGRKLEDMTNISERLDRNFGVSVSGESDRLGIYQPRDHQNDNIGPKWGIGLHVFISGVFLDNLLAVTKGETRGKYNEMLEQKSEYIRHSYGLENGEFTRRKRHLHAEKNEGAEFYTKDVSEMDANEIVDQIQSEFQAWIPVGDRSSETATDREHGVDSNSKEIDTPSSDGGDY